MPVITPQGRSKSKFRAYIEGGPALMAKLNALDLKIKKQVAGDALRAGGEVIRDAWAAAAPVGEAPADPHPGAYRRSLEQPDAVFVKPNKNGASGNVRPGYVAGIAEDDQPRVYAAKLEFRDGEPSARPAFDSSRAAALVALQRALTVQLERGL